MTRPYTFIEFDTWMQRARKQYGEGGARARRAGATAQLGGQLGDVQRIMMQNIDDVLQRGAVLSGECSALVGGGSFDTLLPEN